MKSLTIIIIMNRITIKRINGELRQFMKNKPSNIQIYHNKDNILEIYFKFKGIEETDYCDGEYICKIEHHHEYPVRAPNLYIMTPNGRFQINRKLCLTNTSYHQESWAPAGWSLESFIQAFISVFHSDSKSDRIGIGHIKEKDSKRTIELATKSTNFNNSIIKKNNLSFI